VQTLQFTTENLHKAIRDRESVVFQVGEVDPITAIQEKLRHDKTAYRTSTRSRQTFRTVFEDKNGLLRIEESVHEPQWQAGSGQGIMNSLFQTDSRVYASWETVKKLPVLDNGQESAISEVMMVTGDSTAMITALGDYRGPKMFRHYSVPDNMHSRIDQRRWELLNAQVTRMQGYCIIEASRGTSTKRCKC